MTDTGPDPAGASAEAAAVRRTPGWIRVTLALSLTANLLVLGLLAGAMAARQEPPRSAEVRDVAMAPYLRALGREDRRALESALRGEAGALRENRRALRAEIEATLAALRAEPFRAEAVAESLVAQRTRVAERVRLGDRLFVERIAAMSPAERAALADRLEEMLKRRARPEDDR